MVCGSCYNQFQTDNEVSPILVAQQNQVLKNVGFCTLAN